VIDRSHEETDDPVYADKRNFYKVERWTKDGLHITDLLYAGNSLERAREIFTAAQMFRPGRPYTVRQGIRVLANYPADKKPRGRPGIPRLQVALHLPQCTRDGGLIDRFIVAAIASAAAKTPPAQLPPRLSSLKPNYCRPERIGLPCNCDGRLRTP
jgi:hypothetical protein